MRINGVQNRSKFEPNKTLGISYALHMLLKQGPVFHSRLHYVMRSFIISQWKIITIWYKFPLLLDRVFSELWEGHLSLEGLGPATLCCVS